MRLRNGRVPSSRSTRTPGSRRSPSSSAPVAAPAAADSPATGSCTAGPCARTRSYSSTCSQNRSTKAGSLDARANRMVWSVAGSACSPSSLAAFEISRAHTSPSPARLGPRIRTRSPVARRSTSTAAVAPDSSAIRATSAAPAVTDGASYQALRVPSRARHSPAPLIVSMGPTVGPEPDDQRPDPRATTSENAGRAGPPGPALPWSHRRAVSRSSSSVAAAKDGEDAQQVPVQPDQGDGQRERGPPRLVLRGAVADTLLDHVEVEDQVEHRESGADRGEQQAHRAEAGDARVEAEQARDEIDQEHAGEAHGCDDDHLGEPRCHLDREV